MISPVTRLLIRVFAKGFYRDHAGLLLFFVVSVATYGFFINVLDQNHIPADEVIRHQLGLVLALLSSPAMMALVFVIWFFLSIKSRNYVSTRRRIPENQ